ncbi:MAG: hypothetical protein IKY22_07545 [Bacteroidales bacterium]|nr:hypothetical protein [Bacteroidales bacterium]
MKRIIIICITLSACSSPSVIVSTDTVYVGKTMIDSVFVDRWSAVYSLGDTIVVDRRSTEHHYHLQHDTIRLATHDTMLLRSPPPATCSPTTYNRLWHRVFGFAACAASMAAAIYAYRRHRQRRSS